MKITNVKLYPVGTRRETGGISPHMIVTLGTGEGLVGVGEMSDLGHNPTKPDVDHLEYLLNKQLSGIDPFDPEHIDPIVDGLQAPMGAGIDTAIHDLRGKIRGVPVHDLYGGAYRDRYKICYPIFRQMDMSQFDLNLDRVKRMLALGFDLFRFYVGGDVDIDDKLFRQLRENHGNDFKVKSLDFSNRLDWKQCAAAVERLAWVEPMLVESPAPDIPGTAKARERIPFPVSEHCNSVSEAVAFAGSVDILNIQVSSQGIRRARDMFATAEALGLKTLIGTTQELSIGVSAQGHLGASVPNLDFPGDAAGAQLYVEDVVVDRVKYDNGHLVVPKGPGLGMELDEDSLSKLGSRTWEFLKE